MFVVSISLIIRGESKQADPLGLMSAGAKGESFGVINRKSSLQQYLNQRFSVVCFTAGACGMDMKLDGCCSDTCKPQRGTQAQVIATLQYYLCSICCTENVFFCGNGYSALE